VLLVGTRSGKAAVRCYFEDLARSYTFEGFSPDSFHDAGDHVFCFGHSRSHAVATGQSIDDRFLHAFRIENGKVAAFTDFMDTAAVGVRSGILRVAGGGAGQLWQTGELWKRLQELIGHSLSVTAVSSTGRVARHVLRAMI
jgi:hypothetical protein